jgi:4-aminobutyrate aminotransferase/(S)-3-amino-2-methylpropionate transaminase
MAVESRTETERVAAARGRYVARGVATPPLVVARAEGARVWDVDGKEYVDFAGGLGCHNLGQSAPAVVAAIHEQADRFLHQCFMVGMYEPYVEVCRRLSELWPGSPARDRGERGVWPAAQTDARAEPGRAESGTASGAAETKSILLNSGAEAVENAVKIARAATGRPAVVVFDHAFHGRTNLTMAMTSKVVPYKQGFGPFAPDVHRAPAPYAYRGVSTADAIRGLQKLFKQDVDPSTVACAVLEPVQGEGGFIPMPPDFPPRLLELCAEHGILYVDDEVQSGVGRTGTVWALERYGVEPDLLVSGKSLGGGLPLAAVTGRTEVMDAVAPGGLGGTFSGNPVACAAACVVLDEVARPEFRARAEEVAALLRGRLDALAGRTPAIGEVRGLGSMLAFELEEQTGELAGRITAAARERGLILLSCGLYGNVIRILVPLVATDDELERGLSILEEALGDAASG